jgi:hypothetical protein
MEKLINQYFIKINEFLKDFGFKKSGNYFYKKNMNNWIIINIQKSRDKNSSKFTFNIGVFLKTLGDFYEFGQTQKPEIDDSHWMKRIGHFQTVKSDEWFEIKDNDQLQNVYQKTSRLFRENIIPILELICNDVEMEKIWLKDSDSATTEFQRLLNLSVLLTKRQAENRNKIISDLKEYAKANKLAIDYHLKQLGING